MSEPIVFAKCDPTPGNETLVLIYRPDRSTTKGERQVHIRASSLDFSSPTSRSRSSPTWVARFGEPLEFLQVDVDRDDITVEEWLQRLRGSS